MEQATSFKICYKLGILGEKSLFTEGGQWYDYITLPAHIAAFYQKSIGPTLATVKKPFFIDPITHIFACDQRQLLDKRGQLRRSIEKLVPHYGKTIQSKSGKTPLLPSDLDDKKVLNEIAENVIKYQKEVGEFVNSPSDEEKKYLEILGKPINSQRAPLEFLVTPYFFLDSIDDPWYPRSLSLAQKSMDFKGDKPLYAALLISKDFLKNSKAIDKIVQDYKGFDGYLVWVNDFDENSEPLDVLIALLKFINKLAQYKKPVINLYGGFFSIIASQFGLTGLSSGICYSTKKVYNEFLPGGSIPPRYYIPEFKIKFSEIDARRLLSTKSKLQCKCQICKMYPECSKNSEEFFNSLFEPISDTAKTSDRAAKKHFMCIRKSEVTRLNNLEDIQVELKRVLDEYAKDSEVTIFNELNHLKLWLAATENI